MIRNREEFANGLPAGYDGEFVWDFLLGAFGNPKIEPMDFDGVVEIHGGVLIFETKNPGVSTKQGQLLALHAMALKPDVWVIHLSAKRAEDISGWTVWWNVGGPVRTHRYTGGPADLYRFCQHWSRAMEARPRTPVDLPALLASLEHTPVVRSANAVAVPLVADNIEW
jgi:hypothetical protein